MDDVPYGSASFLSGGAAVPDLDPSDLARVEVLRGPQGTLYGASSIGGLLKFVTVDPSTEGISGRAQVGISKIRNGGDLGYNVRGSINVPLSDTVAIRASAFDRSDPGYIDDPIHGLHGVNSVDVTGGRLSALWQLSPAFSLKIGALYQRNKGDGASSVDPALGDLQQSRVPGTGWFDRKAQAYSATLAGNLAATELTAVSGYVINSFSESLDYGFIHAGNAQRFFGVGGAELLAENKAKRFTQELRLVTPLGPRFEWLLGGFYADERADYLQAISALNTATGEHVGIIRSTTFPTTYKEKAAFSDLTFKVDERIDVQFGGRESKIDQTYIQTQIGPAAITPGTSALSVSKASAFTYLVTPRFKPSLDFMMYARFASGYRPGGPNADAGPGTPQQFDPDKTQNYEIGFKGKAFNRLVTFDASLFYIDWKDIQLLVLNPATSRAFNANGGRAKSQGLELSVESRPVRGLTIAAWVAYNDAKLTENLPATSTVRGVSGDRLPNTSKRSGNLSIDKQFTVSGDVRGVVGGSLSYVGDRLSVLVGGTGPRQVFPAYTKADVHAGLRYESWAADLFITNVADKRGVLYGGIGAFPPTAFLYIQPRTFGLSIARMY